MPQKKSSTPRLSVTPRQKAVASKRESSSLGAKIKRGAEKVTERITNVMSSRPADIVAAIKEDHKGLRNFLEILKDTDKEMSERRAAYASFSALLKSHSACEEQAVYATVDKLTGREMRLEVAEGYVEHQLATDLMKRLEATTEAMQWSAHANVLSEIVEHHLKEEERDLLPKIRKAANAKVDEAMLTQFVALRQKSQKKVTKKNAGVLKSA